MKPKTLIALLLFLLASCGMPEYVGAAPSRSGTVNDFFRNSEAAAARRAAPDMLTRAENGAVPRLRDFH